MHSVRSIVSCGRIARASCGIAPLLSQCATSVSAVSTMYASGSPVLFSIRSTRYVMARVMAQQPRIVMRWPSPRSWYAAGMAAMSTAAGTAAAGGPIRAASAAVAHTIEARRRARKTFSAAKNAGRGRAASGATSVWYRQG